MGHWAHDCDTLPVDLCLLCRYERLEVERDEARGWARFLRQMLVSGRGVAPKEGGMPDWLTERARPESAD